MSNWEDRYAEHYTNGPVRVLVQNGRIVKGERVIAPQVTSPPSEWMRNADPERRAASRARAQFKAGNTISRRGKK